MRRVATAEELAAGREIGRAALASLEPFARAMLPEDASEEALSAAVGELLVMTLFQVANEVEWLNRVHVTEGIGRAFGTVFVQWPRAREGLLRRFADGVAAREQQFEVRGSA